MQPQTEYIYRTLFTDPAIILIGSTARSKLWKTGKTDFFLKMSEDLLELGLKEEVASNTHTFGHYPCITDFENLKIWLHRNPKKKLYGLDEGNVHLAKRNAMTNLSRTILSLFPEISKARATLVVIGQEIRDLDSEMGGARSWVKGTFEKANKKTAIVRSSLLDHPRVLRDIPPTSIQFDPYLLAPFTLKATVRQEFPDDDIQKFRDWVEGKSWKEQFKHPQQANRFYREVGKRLLGTYSLFTSNRVEGEIPTNREGKG